MDSVGTIMGAVTVPMAILLAASLLAALWLLVAGPALPVLAAIVALAIGLGLAWMLERVVMLLDDVTLAARRRGAAFVARATALFAGAMPMALLLGWEYASLTMMARPAASAAAISAWLLAYGVATAPWTLFAQLVDSDRRTLCGIRAYAGHLSFWLLSAALLLGAPKLVALLLMVLPAALPVTVGTLLAAADREALRNVRI